MTNLYCATLKELRGHLETRGIDPSEGGFFMVAEMPVIDDDTFDVWEIETDLTSNQEEFIMVTEVIPPEKITRLEAPAFSM